MRNIRITFRADEKFKEKIKKQSEKANMSMISYIYNILSKKDINVIEEGKNIYFELHKIGNNVNQIARKLNSGIATRSDIDEIYTVSKDINKIWQSLNSLISKKEV